MKRIWCALLALALSASFATGMCEEWGIEHELEAEAQRAAEAVTSMEEAFAIIPPDSLWTDGWPSYAQEYGFEPVALAPDAAYDALRAAFDEDEGSISYAELFETWGLSEADGTHYLPVYCRPVLRTLCKAAPTVCGEMSIEIVAFDHAAEIQETGALVFMKLQDGDWQLIDYMPCEAESVLLCGDRNVPGLALIQFLFCDHGTGYYAEDIALYNPMTRRCEAGYTRVGHDVPGNYGLYVASQVYTDWMRVNIVRSTAFVTTEWNDEDDMYAYVDTQRAQEAHLFVYEAKDDISFALVTDKRVENASPAMLAIDDYADGELIVP